MDYKSIGSIFQASLQKKAACSQARTGGWFESSHDSQSLGR